jgi:hypothetical protein
MVYKTQNYWVFGLCPSSGIVETRKHNVSETGSVSVLRWEGINTYSVGSLRKSYPQFRLAHLKTETDAVSETLSRMLDSNIEDDYSFSALTSWSLICIHIKCFVTTGESSDMTHFRLTITTNFRALTSCESSLLMWLSLLSWKCKIALLMPSLESFTYIHLLNVSWLADTMTVSCFYFEPFLVFTFSHKAKNCDKQ